MPKKPKVSFAALMAEAETIAADVCELSAQAEFVDLEGPSVHEFEALQRQFALIARDASQAMVRLYTNLRVAQAKDREKNG